MSIDFQNKKGFICDMDGVLYHGSRLLPGAVEFINWLQKNGREYLFLTNNSGMTPRELHQKLERLGVNVPEEHFLPAPWLQPNFYGSRHRAVLHL